MTATEQMQAVEERVFQARLAMADVLGRAGVALSTWSRAKARGTIRAKTLGRVEDAIAEIERERAGEADAA